MTIESETYKTYTNFGERSRDVLQKTGLQLLSSFSYGFEVPTRGTDGIFHLKPSVITDPTAQESDANILGLHVRAYPGMSSEEEMAYNARFINIAKWREVRSAGRVSFGDEQAAVIDHPFLDENGLEQVGIEMVPWDEGALTNLVIQAVDDIRTNNVPQPTRHHEAYQSTAAQPTTRFLQS
ncbi:MAG: hypothetical protein JWN26_452 [Candidatus Saccharibacteria bacterium]|nr:hypothetical protein [Candidatus Saccharibacteria bacterium]